MSNTVDNRIVSMHFDNQQFEKNVATSMETLDGLKKSLKFDGASKGLQEVGAAAKGCDISPLGTAVDAVRLKFSALQVASITVFTNMVNSAVNAGKNIVKAFTIDPVKSGLQEYETQINAVQTILANTQSKGKTIYDVNAALDELNTYADKTIYNFTEMTRNIGTFTAAGVGLDDSVSAIKGIANLAAVSGSTSQQASTAMYQLSQALASGTVKLQDWNSVVNAGMGGQVFQEALKRTAKNYGHNVDEMIEKYGSFRESLSQGQWLTAEVLTETLSQISGAYTEADLLAKGYTEAQAKEILDLAETAVNAATKVKTFTQLVDTLKEGAQSGWTQTWELFIGDFEEAKELWTGVSDTFGELINASAEARNKVLGGALNSNWKKLINEINAAGVETTVFEQKVREVAKHKHINIDQMVADYGSLEKAFRAGAISSNILSEALSKITVTSSKLSNVSRTLSYGMTGDDVKEVEAALISLGYTLTGKDGKEYGGDGVFGTLTRDAVKAFQETHGLKVTGLVDEETIAALREATGESKEFSSAVHELIGKVDEAGGREIIIQSLKNVWGGLLDIAGPIKEAFSEIFPPITSEQIFNLITKFEELTSKFKLNSEQSAKLKATFKGLFSGIDIGWQFVKSLLKGVTDLIPNFKGLGTSILNVTGSIGDWITNLRDSVKDSNIFGQAIGAIVGVVNKAFGKLKQFVTFVKGKLKMPGFEGFLSLMKSIWGFVQKVGSKVAKIGTSIGSMLATAFEGGDIKNAVDILNGGLLAGVLLSVKKFFTNFGKSAEEGFGLFDTLKDVGSSIADAFGAIGDALQTWQQSLKVDMLMKIALAIGVLAAAVLVISAINPERLAASLGAITVLFGELMGSMAIFNKFGGLNIKGVGKTVRMMIGMSVAVLILATALKSISSLNWDELGRGLLGVAALMAIMLIAAKAMTSKGNETTFVKGAGQMLIMAGALIVMASALRMISSLSLEQVIIGVGGLAVLMAILTVAAKTLQNNGDKFVKGAGQMLIMAGALVIMASALRIISSLSLEQVVIGVGGLAALMAVLTIAAKTMQTAGGKSVKGAGQMLIMAGALVILVQALKMISSMSLESLVTGLTTLGFAMIILVGSLNSMQGTVGGAFALLVAVGAIAALMAVLKDIGSMSLDSIVNGLVAIGGAMIILVGGLNAMTGGIGGAFALMITAGALGILTPVLKTLGEMSLWGIIKGLVALAAAFAVFGVAGLILTPLAPVLLISAAAIAIFGAGMLGLGVGVLALSAGLTALAASGTAVVAALTIIVTGVAALIPTILTELGNGIVAFCGVISEGAPAIASAIKAVVLSLVDVLVECIPAIVDGALKLVAGILSGLVTYTPQIVDSLISFLIGVLDGLAVRMPELIASALNLMVTFFSELTSALFSFDAGTLISAAVGVGLFAALLGVLNLVAPLIPGAMLGILGLAGVVAELVLLMAAFGALAQIPGLTWLIEQGGELLAKVGTAIGQFVGGIVGGLGGGILQSFLSSISGLSEADAVKMDSFASILGKMADVAAKVPKSGGLLQAITGTPDLVGFTTGMVGMGVAIKVFSNTVSDIPDDAVTKMNAIGGVIGVLVDVATKVPETGGLAQAITGTPDLASFSLGLVALGAAIKTFSDSVSEIGDAEIAKIDALIPVITSLINVAALVPASGGLAQAITGTPDLGSFATALGTFGTELASFTTSVTAITQDDISKINALIPVITSLIGVATIVPASGGLAQAILGAPDLGTFAGELQTFGTKIVEFSSAVSEVTSDDIAKMTSIGEAAQTLVGVATSLSGYNDSSWFNTNLTEFAKELKNFGDKMSDFNDSVSGVDTSKVIIVAAAARIMLGLATSAATVDGSALKTFGGNLASFGDSVYYFYDSISGVDVATISSIATAFTDLASISGSASSDLKAFVDSLGTIGADSVSAFISEFDGAGTKAMLAITNMLAAAAVGAIGGGIALMSAFKTGLSACISTVRSFKKSFQDAGYYLAAGFAAGILSGTDYVKRKAREMARAAKRVVEDELDINSPSRVFMQLGKFTAEGFANGVEAFTGRVKSASSAMANTAVDGTRNAIASIVDIIDSSVDTQPTIRPVLDLSDVEAGAGRLNGMFSMQPAVAAMANVGAISTMMSNNQNGSGSDVVSAIKDLGRKITAMSGNSYNVNGVTYDDGSNVGNAVGSLVRAIRMERRA